MDFNFKSETLHIQVMDETRLKEYEKAIEKNLKGWISFDDLHEVIPTISVHNVKELQEFVNQRDKINIRSTGSTATQSTYFIKHKTQQPYKEYKQKIPTETHSIFDNWVGEGKAPRVIVALIQYFSNQDKTAISSVANENNCCQASIHKNKEEMIEDLRDNGIKAYK